MKARFLLAVIICASFRFFIAAAQPSAVELKPLSNYFLSNKTELGKGVNCKVVSKQTEFEKYFGVAKTMNNTIVIPDFTKEIVLMIAMPETRKETVLAFDRANRVGADVNVFFHEKKSYPLTYSIVPVALAAIPKYDGVTTINFYQGGRMIKSIKIK